MKLLSWSLGLFAVALVVCVSLTLLRNAPALLHEPGLLTRLWTYLSRNVAELKPNSAFAELESPLLEMSDESAITHIRRRITKMGWQVDDRSPLDHRPANMRLHAIVRSPVFGFIDDVTIWIEVVEEGKLRVRARSASRLGRGDLGANAAHLVRLRQAIAVR